MQKEAEMRNQLRDGGSSPWWVIQGCREDRMAKMKQRTAIFCYKSCDTVLSSQEGMKVARAEKENSVLTRGGLRKPTAPVLLLSESRAVLCSFWVTQLEASSPFFIHHPLRTRCPKRTAFSNQIQILGDWDATEGRAKTDKFQIKSELTILLNLELVIIL